MRCRWRQQRTGQTRAYSFQNRTSGPWRRRRTQSGRIFAVSTVMILTRRGLNGTILNHDGRKRRIDDYPSVGLPSRTRSMKETRQREISALRRPYSSIVTIRSCGSENRLRRGFFVLVPTVIVVGRPGRIPGRVGSNLARPQCHRVLWNAAVKEFDRLEHGDRRGATCRCVYQVDLDATINSMKIRAECGRTHPCPLVQQPSSPYIEALNLKTDEIYDHGECARCCCDLVYKPKRYIQSQKPDTIQSHNAIPKTQ